MDRLVDHLFIFEGNGEVRDFPGNYSQYRELQKSQPSAETTSIKKDENQPALVPNSIKKKLSYKEQREFDQLENEIKTLEKERSAIYEQLNDANQPYDKLQQLTVRIGEINDAIDLKEMRWLELSENA
jgi:ATP-binding cassette subfamily F protein uup